jgi:hypothetical protein
MVAARCWFGSNTRSDRQGREYYHINYGLLGEFFGVPQDGSRRPSAVS